MVELLARAVDTFEVMERMAGVHVKRWYGESAEVARAAAARLREEMAYQSPGGQVHGRMGMCKEYVLAARERINGGPLPEAQGTTENNLSQPQVSPPEGPKIPSGPSGSGEGGREAVKTIRRGDADYPQQCRGGLLRAMCWRPEGDGHAGQHDFVMPIPLPRFRVTPARPRRKKAT